MEKEVCGIEVELVKPFSVVRESLERIGIVNRDKKIISPSCYLLHKRGRYYIMHFKNLLKLDGKQTTYSEDDNNRQTAIAILLQKWGLVNVVEEGIEENGCRVFVLPFNQKQQYQVVHKYSIGHSK